MAPKPKEKAKASAVATPAIAIEDLFTSLNRHIQRSEYEQAVKVSDQILAAAPGDEDAIRCKVVALVKADSIEDALVAIKDCSKKGSVDLSFFKAYCLYRQNKLEEALESLKGQEGSTESMLLESQILYRLGKMGVSVDIYQKLPKSTIDSLEINLVAGLVSAGRSSEVQGTLDSLRVKATSSFELAYNTACSLIEREKYKDAEQLLLSARRIGQETLMEENLADDDVEIELAPIAVQIAYVQQILGNTQEAVASYTDLVKRNLADESSLAVAVNNLIALKGPKDVSDGLRKLDKLIEKSDGPEKFQLARGLDLKLSQKQREAIYTNRMLLLLHSNKMDQARELVSALPGMFPGSLMPVLLQAAVHVRENKAAKAEEILGQYVDKFPDRSKVILLARAQVAAAAGHPQIAADSLAKIPEIQHKPATVATIVSLKERAGDIDGADAMFDSAIKWWSNAMTEDNKLNTIMQEAAAFKLRYGRKDEAARLYEQLVKSHGSIEALVGLIQTAAHGDIEKAEAYEKQLKPLPGLKALDVDSLEKTSGAKHAEKGTNAGATETYEAKSKDKAKKKRKRKPKYPKGFDPANPGPLPDPERWLPKRERSSYRPKRKDKRAAQVSATTSKPRSDASAPTCSKRDRSWLEDTETETDNIFMSKEEIEKCSPSRKDGIDAMHEAHLRYSYCAFLQNLGIRLDLPQTTIGTAMVLCHRFFVRRSHACHDRFLIATAALFLAAKSEETARPLNNVLKASCEIFHKQDLAVLSYFLPVDWFEQYRERITEAEQMILTTLNFELTVQHPYESLTSTLEKLGLSETVLVNLALHLVSEGLRSSLWLQFKPYQIAAGAAYLASKFLNMDFASHHSVWKEFQTSPNVLRDVAQQLMELF